MKRKKSDFIGSIVLGLNDGLIEMTGALAGLSFALQNTNLVALAGSITGIAAALSMASSEYLSKHAENSKKSLKASLYTGITYFTVVVLLVLPFLLVDSYKVAVGVMLAVAFLIILLFTYFTPAFKGHSFGKRFLEMFSISFGVALISFLIGMALRGVIGVDI